MMNKVHTKHIKKCILIDVKISKTFTIVMSLDWLQYIAVSAVYNSMG